MHPSVPVHPRWAKRRKFSRIYVRALGVVDLMDCCMRVRAVENGVATAGEVIVAIVNATRTENVHSFHVSEAGATGARQLRGIRYQRTREAHLAGIVV